MIKISPNTRFSRQYATGTAAFRLKISDEMNQKVFRRIIQLYEKKDEYGIEAIKNNYNTLLPERKKINITPLSQKECNDNGGSVVVDEDRTNLLSGYSIEIPASKKKKLNIKYLSSFMHESTHILDYLLNPKYIANYRQMCEKDIYSKSYFEIYDKYFYNTQEMKNNNKEKMLELAESETRKRLRRVSYKEKIIFLNYMKYSLEMEYHAYQQDIFYAKILQSLGKPVDKLSSDDCNLYMAFPEKINIINKLIKEEFDNIRKQVGIKPSV